MILTSTSHSHIDTHLKYDPHLHITRLSALRPCDLYELVALPLQHPRVAHHAQRPREQPQVQDEALGVHTQRLHLREWWNIVSHVIIMIMVMLMTIILIITQTITSSTSRVEELTRHHTPFDLPPSHQYQHHHHDHRPISTCRRQ
jgi:hypothetical protein